MPRELITFEVCGQLFGLDILSIREIRAWSPITPLPGVPEYIAGVVNLRGTVLPVLHLAARLGWPATPVTPRHAIIVAQLGMKIFGLIVETVRDIVTVADSALQQPPGSDDRIVAFLDGLVAVGDRMVMVLDLATLHEPPPVAFVEPAADKVLLSRTE